MNTGIEIRDIKRPPRALVEALAKIGSATLSSELAQRLGIRDPQIRGPRPLKPGRTVAGPALTLQCMPKREDLYGEAEYEDPERQLHRHVLYPTQPGDVVVVDARGDLGSGIFGEMMLTFFAGRGGAGVVIDGCIRDFGQSRRTRPRRLGQGRDAELPCPDQHHSLRRERADRLRERAGHPRRHHRR